MLTYTRTQTQRTFVSLLSHFRCLSFSLIWLSCVHSPGFREAVSACVSLSDALAAAKRERETARKALSVLRDPSFFQRVDSPDGSGQEFEVKAEDVSNGDKEPKNLPRGDSGHTAAVHIELAKVLMQDSGTVSNPKPAEDSDVAVALHHLYASVAMSSISLPAEHLHDDQAEAEAKEEEETTEGADIHIESAMTGKSKGRTVYPARVIRQAWLALALAHSGELQDAEPEADEEDAFGDAGRELRTSRMANLAYQAPDPELANALWLGAARLGSLPALLRVARALHKGEPMHRDDTEHQNRALDWQRARHCYERALKLLKRDKSGAADRDPVYLLREELALMLSEGGNGLQCDPETAGELLQEAGTEAMMARDMFASQRCFEKAAQLEQLGAEEDPEECE